MKHIKKYKKGGKKFPDLTGDGKVTMADILKGRGVKKAGKGMKYQMGGKQDAKKVAMMKGLEAKIKKAKGTPEAKALVNQYRKLTGTGMKAMGGMKYKMPMAGKGMKHKAAGKGMKYGK